jgi:hypothetical protein
MPPLEARQQQPYRTWYAPHDQQEVIDRAVWFALSQPGVSAIASAGDVRILELMLDAAQRLYTLSEAVQAAIMAAADPAQTIYA